MTDEIDRAGRADIEQRPRPGAEQAGVHQNFQSRSRAIKAAAASTIAMKPNSAHWFGACDETSDWRHVGADDADAGQRLAMDQRCRNRRDADQAQAA